MAGQASGARSAASVPRTSTSLWNARSATAGVHASAAVASVRKGHPRSSWGSGHLHGIPRADHEQLRAMRAWMHGPHACMHANLQPPHRYLFMGLMIFGCCCICPGRYCGTHVQHAMRLHAAGTHLVLAAGRCMWGMASTSSVRVAIGMQGRGCATCAACCASLKRACW